MHSSDTDAHNHVNSHLLRRITYVTCQASHTYNTLPVLFSNLLPSSRVVAQISSLLATLCKPTIYQRYRIHVKKSLHPTFEYSWGGGVKGMSLPLVSRSVDLVYFNISPLYQIISSHQFYQLSYYIPHFKRDLCREHHVRDPESSRRNSWFLIIDSHVKNKKYMSFVSISSLTGECAAQKLKKMIKNIIFFPEMSQANFFSMKCLKNHSTVKRACVGRPSVGLQ